MRLELCSLDGMGELEEGNVLLGEVGDVGMLDMRNV